MTYAAQKESQREGIRTNWPTEDGQYKVVQLEVSLDEVLSRPTVFSQIIIDGDHQITHAGTLEGFLRQNEIPYDGAELKPGIRGPKPFGNNARRPYRAVGMGKCIKEGNRYMFNMASDDYGIRINREHAEHEQEVNPDKEIMVSQL